VKLVYGMGQGTARIGQHSPVGNTLLALFGEGGVAMGPPQVMVLNNEIRNRVRVKSLTNDLIQQVFDAGHAVDHQVARASNVVTEKSIILIAPIPAYSFVLDGLNQDLDAEDSLAAISCLLCETMH